MAPQPSWRSALRNLSLKGLSLGVERACRFVVVVASARVLGQTAFGRFVFASTVTALLALGTDLGLGLWTTRALARDGSPSHRIVRLGLALRGLASIPYALIVGAVTLLASPGEMRVAMMLLGVAALVNAFVDHFGAILRGYERFRDEAQLNASRAVLTAGAGLLALLVMRSLGALCAGLAAASLGAAVYGLAKLREYLPGLDVKNQSGLDGARVRTTLRESLPIWFAGLLSLLYFKVDTLFLQWMAGDAELGAYGAAYKLFEGSMMAPAVVLAVMFPQLARARDDLPMRRRLERHVAALLLFSGLALAAACVAGGSWLIQVIFGAGFARSVASLRVLSLGLPLVFLNYGLTHFLVARDLQRMTTWLALMMLVLNVTLDLVLIPTAKGPGAAWATVISEIALTLCCLGALNRYAGPTRSLPLVPGGAKRDRRAA
jgi:O-antigen/teichoic acid export membrane protein